VLRKYLSNGVDITVFTRIVGYKQRADHVAAPVSSATLHPSASVLASCSGAKRYPEVYDDPPRRMENGHSNSTDTGGAQAESENILKIWALQETQNQDDL
jgi:hypothetical protein